MKISGRENVNSRGTKMKIIEYRSSDDITVQFQDKYKVTKRATYSNFLKGNVKNPYDITVFGVGYLGEGKAKTKTNGKSTPVYLMWMSMLQRCYAEKWKDKFPAYYGICSVCDEWKCFQNFAVWYDQNYYEVSGRLHLDKDIIVAGNKIYSPDTCLLVPQRINMLFVGDKNKNEANEHYALHISEMATAYKNVIPNKVYHALIERSKMLRKD